MHQNIMQSLKRK